MVGSSLPVGRRIGSKGSVSVPNGRPERRRLRRPGTGDLVELLGLHKRLLVRQSWHAPTVGRCVQEAIQHGIQALQQSPVPEVQRVVQQAQQLAGTIQQASSQVGGQSRMGGTPRMSGTSGMGGQL